MPAVNPFPLNPLLSYPHFNTYRLSSSPSQSDVSTFPLPSAHKASTRWGREWPVGVKEVRRSAGWDGLVQVEDGVAYVDEKFGVVLVKFEETPDGLQPNFTPIHTFQPLSTPSSPPENPSLLPLPTLPLLLASSGTGDLLLVPLHPSSTPSRTLAIDHLELGPFLLHAVASVEGGVEVLLERTVRTTVVSASARAKVEISVELVCLRIALTGEEEVKIKWCSLTGEDFLSSASYLPESKQWLLTSPSPFTAPTAPSPTTATATAAASSDGPTNPPFSWSQTPTTVTLLFKLPQSFTAKAIHLLLRPNTLTLLLYARGGVLSPELMSWLDLAGSEGVREWWDAIDPSESTWSLRDADSDGDGRILEVELGKRNEKVKWPNPFAPYISVPNNPEPVPDLEIPESLAAGELEYSSSRLDMYHDDTELPDFEGGIGALGDETGLPGLLREEMEDEGEFESGMGGEGEGISGLGGAGGKTGKEMVFSFVAADGVVLPPTSGNGKAVTAQLLSTPFSPSQVANQGIIIKSSVDGAVFLPPSPPSPADKWVHQSTSPALSFVISSKRDAQYIHHSPGPSAGSATFIFESRQPTGSGGNLYIYYPPGEERGTNAQGRRREEEARQGVLKFGVDEKGEGLGGLLGVKMVELQGRKGKEGEGRQVVVGLLERGLVVLQNIW